MNTAVNNKSLFMKTGGRLYLNLLVREKEARIQNSIKKIWSGLYKEVAF